MSNLAEALSEFRTVQLEGRLAIYESLFVEISKLESMEAKISEVKSKLENVAAIWNEQAQKRKK